MKVGIMGGTFNPIHKGHLMLATLAMEQCSLNNIWFMPSGLPAHKSNEELLDAKHRMQMVKLATEEEKSFIASAFEMEREGFTYTSDTMVALKKDYPEIDFYFIIGGDSLMKFHQWVRPDVISAHTTLLAAGRSGYSKEKLEKQVIYLKQQFGTKVSFLDMPEFPVASSEIRRWLKAGQYEKANEVLPKKVVDYIKQNRLYQK